MKNILIVTLLIFTVSSFNSYGHEHRGEKEKQHNEVTLTPEDSMKDAAATNMQQSQAIDYFPNYHPLVVHFPIVLLLFALLFQVLSLIFPSGHFGRTTFILLLMGTATAWLAVSIFHADAGDLKGKAAEIFQIHEQMSDYTVWTATLALAVKLLAMVFSGKKWVEWIVMVLLVISAVFVSVTGHYGAKLVYMQGVGPLGKYLEQEHHDQAL